MRNDRYESPTGKPSLVLDGGDGGWKQPQQLILMSLYVDGPLRIDLNGARGDRRLRCARRQNVHRDVLAQ
jgi:hypothetical protein